MHVRLRAFRFHRPITERADIVKWGRNDYASIKAEREWGSSGSMLVHCSRIVVFGPLISKGPGMEHSADKFFLSHPDPMWVYDLETLRFLEVNKSAIAKYGYSRDEFLGMTIVDIRPDTDRFALRANVAAVTEGRDEAGVWQHQLKSGALIYVEITGHTIEHEGRRAELIAARDVTERSKAENALAQANRMLEIAGTSAKFGAWRYEVTADRVEWSSETARIHDEPDGHSPIVSDALSYYVPEHRDRITSVFQTCIDQGQPFDETLQLITAKGRKIWVRATGEAERVKDGRTVAVQGSFQDVSELEVTRARAEESEKLLAIAGRAVKLGGWRVDLMTQKVTWTDGTAAIHELPPGTPPTIGGGIDYFAPNERASARKVFEDCATHGIPFDNLRDLITAKGNKVRVRSFGIPVRDTTGKIVAVQGAMQDITDLTIAQREASELSRRLAETLENISDAFFTLDRDTRYTYANPKAEELMRHKRDALIGSRVVDVFPELAGSVVETNFTHACDTGETVRFEYFHARFDSTFRISAHPTPEGLAVYFSNITEELRQTEQLRLLEAATAKINDMIVITDVAKRDAAGNATIAYVNSAFERITGFSRQEVIGRTPRILQGPKTQRSELDRIRRAVKTHSPVRAELINYTKSGQEYWLELDIVPLLNDAGVVTHYVAVQRDITDRRRAEEALRTSETRFRMIAEAAGNAAFDWNITEGRMWWSDGMERQFGHPPDPEGKVPSVWSSNVHPDDEIRVFETVDQLLSGEIDTIHNHYRFRRADGSWARVEDHGFAIRNEEGRTTRILGSLSDVSNKLEMEDRLRQSQKLEAVGQLTGGVAHDFNNLLTIIVGNIEMLQDSLAEDNPLRRFADMGARAADRASELTNRLLVFSRKQALQPQVIDVNAVIGGIKDMLRRTLSADIDIEIALTDGIWPTEIDRAQVEAALLNLAINSRDAMPDGGSLTIETANVELDEDDITAEPNLTVGKYVRITVSDTGHGIPEDQIDHVFEPFFTTKTAGQGTGLGLSMVYGFAKQSGGHILIFSELNKGTKVRLYFPMYDGDRQTNAVETQDKPLQRGHETILVVEDDALILQQLTVQLTGLGYQVLTASAGAATLDILRKRSDVDLLLTDVVLPGGMNGRQIADAAQALCPDVKVLFTSGYSENVIVHHGRLDRDANFLGKPYRRSTLAAKVREVLDT